MCMREFYLLRGSVDECPIKESDTKVHETVTACKAKQFFFGGGKGGGGFPEPWNHLVVA